MPDIIIIIINRLKAGIPCTKCVFLAHRNSKSEIRGSRHKNNGNKYERKERGQEGGKVIKKDLTSAKD